MKKNLADDKQLIQQFIEFGDKKAFVDLINRYIQGIRKLLFTLLNGCMEDVEDAEQKILITLYENLSHFRFESSFKTYLYRLSRNKAVDIVRKRKREEKLLRFIAFNFFRRPGDPEEWVVKHDEKSRVIKMLFRLDKDERLLILLKDVEGFSIKEISKILLLPEGTVKSRLHRSRRKLVKLLEGNTI